MPKYTASRAFHHQLLLMRHGKAATSGSVDDYYRPLKDKGKRQAQRVGLWLAQQGYIPDRIIASPAERARVTAEKTCKVMGLAADSIVEIGRLYQASVRDLAGQISQTPDQVQRLLVIAHNPALDELLHRLLQQARERLSDGRLMNPASLAVLQLQGSWADLLTQEVRLDRLIQADSLPQHFPYPALDSQELRPRPAYYYHQSAVIPFRTRDGRLEILIMGSSKQKHWVIPKGIVDPGHSAQDSAAKEAWEEAGIEGEVGQQALGEYHYEKWGADTRVQVFPMRVTRVLPETEWLESHRTRQWVSAEQAASLLKQAELGEFVRRLS